MIRFLLVISLLFSGLRAISQEDLSQFKSDILIDSNDTLAYRILYPKNFDPKKKYPLLFFLHGAGERGNDNIRQLKYVVPFMDSIEEQYPSIIIVPQCSDSSFWANIKNKPNTIPAIKREIIFYPESAPTTAMRLLIFLTKKWQSEKFIDKNKVYIGGMSMGGMGTYEILIRQPIHFAAAFVICGGTNVIALKQKLGKTPIWIFHGTDDPVVPVDYGREVASMLRLEKKKVKYTEYPGIGHDSWLNALQEKDLIPWIYENKK